MREAVYINKGLFALKKCIRGLNKRDEYIPYQVRLDGDTRVGHVCRRME
jgi:hypothetical protein